MDRRQMVAQRAREFFGERLEDVIHMVRQDRQELRGWEEPAHLRAVVRKSLREGAEPLVSSELAVELVEFGRAAGEPERGQQREAIGQLLEAGSVALEKVARDRPFEMTPEEVLGLEGVLLLYARPALLLDQGRLPSVPPFWNLLADQAESIELTQAGVGRIELLGHPEFDWAGTAFLVSDTVLLTTRRTVEMFAENPAGHWQFRPGISAWMDYRVQPPTAASAGYRIRSVIGVHERYDLALLEVDPPQHGAEAPVPLPLAGRAPDNLNNRPVYLIGYPVRDSRRNEPEIISRIFRDVFNAKRIQPGVLRSAFAFQDLWLLHHDAAPLGQNIGSCIVDLETHQVLALNLSGRYLDTGTAIPLWTLRDDPLFQRANIPFADNNPQQLQEVNQQLERLARTRYWGELRDLINNYHQRVFARRNGFRD